MANNLIALKIKGSKGCGLKRLRNRNDQKKCTVIPGRGGGRYSLYSDDRDDRRVFGGLKFLGVFQANLLKE